MREYSCDLLSYEQSQLGLYDDCEEDAIMASLELRLGSSGDEGSGVGREGSGPIFMICVCDVCVCNFPMRLFGQIGICRAITSNSLKIVMVCFGWKSSQPWMKVTRGGVLEFVTRHGRVGSARLCGGDWKRGVKILQWPPALEERCQYSTSVWKVCKKGGPKSTILKHMRLWAASHKPKLYNGFQNRVKILYEWKNRGQNSTSLKMGVKILHGWKIGVKILQCLKRGVNILHATPKSRGQNSTYR